MPDTQEVSIDHEEFDEILRQAQSLIDSGESDEEIIDETRLDPETVAILREEGAEEAAYRAEQEEEIASADTMNKDLESADEEAASSVDGIEPGISESGGSEGAGAAGGMSPSSAATELSSAAEDAAGQQAAQQASQQQAQQAQQASQQQAQAQQQQAAMEQFNAQQQAAWQQAMQQQQTQQHMAQMQQQAQMQAVDQTAEMDYASDEEITAAVEELFADQGNHVESGEGGEFEADSGEYVSGTEVQEGELGGADNVSFDKTFPDGAMSEDEIRAAVNQAADAVGVSDDPEVRKQFENLYIRLTEHESGHNPNAANGWDTNAVGAEQEDGFPAQSSRGLAQCIPETFSTYHVEGTSNSIYDPVASIAASMNYISSDPTYGVDLNTGDGLAEFGSTRGVDVSTGSSEGAWVGY